MTVNEKVVRQEEEAKQAAEPGEHLRHLSAYNRRPSWARSPNDYSPTMG